MDRKRYYEGNRKRVGGLGLKKKEKWQQDEKGRENWFLRMKMRKKGFENVKKRGMDFENEREKNGFDNQKNREE